jgi:hypothetical protein
MPEVHVYVTKPPDKDVPALEDVENALRRLDHVSEVRAYQTYSVLTISFKGGRNEENEIEHAIEGTGYEISRLSVRSDFPRE